MAVALGSSYSFCVSALFENTTVETVQTYKKHMLIKDARLCIYGKQNIPAKHRKCRGEAGKVAAKKGKNWIIKKAYFTSKILKYGQKYGRLYAVYSNGESMG